MSGYLRVAAFLMSLTLGTVGSAAPDVEMLIRGLARTAPATIAFSEVRFSPLLVAPIIVSGELGYGGPQMLDRRVTSPHLEKTTIRDESVSVGRDGEPARTFALKRAPELRGLLTAFTGLLSGDPTVVRRSFSVEATGEEAAWNLVLTPTEVRARRQVKEILVTGHGKEPRCFATFNAQDGASVLLLGTAAIAPAPDVVLEDLLEYCSAK